MFKKAVVFLGLIIFANICFAQARNTEFAQRGIATSGIVIEGYNAAHPSLPIGSKAIVSSAETGITVEVTIVGRIPASTSRIIDLSSDAAAVLGFEHSGEVIVMLPVLHVINIEPVIEQEPEPELDLESELVFEPELDFEPELVFEPDLAIEPEESTEEIAYEPEIESIIPEIEPTPEIVAAEAPEPTIPYTIIINNYIMSPEHTSPAAPTASPAVPQPLPAQPLVPRTINITPGLPDPNNNKIYRLQIGSFSSENMALRAFILLQNAGFTAVQERAGDFFRIMAVDVPSASVFHAVEQFEALGFTEVWIRE